MNILKFSVFEWGALKMLFEVKWKGKTLLLLTGTLDLYIQNGWWSIVASCICGFLLVVVCTAKFCFLFFFVVKIIKVYSHYCVTDCRNCFVLQNWTSVAIKQQFPFSQPWVTTILLFVPMNLTSCKWNRKVFTFFLFMTGLFHWHTMWQDFLF